MCWISGGSLVRCGQLDTVNVLESVVLEVISSSSDVVRGPARCRTRSWCSIAKVLRSQPVPHPKRGPCWAGPCLSRCNRPGRQRHATIGPCGGGEVLIANALESTPVPVLAAQESTDRPAPAGAASALRRPQMLHSSQHAVPIAYPPIDVTLVTVLRLDGSRCERYRICRTISKSGEPPDEAPTLNRVDTRDP